MKIIHEVDFSVDRHGGQRLSMSASNGSYYGNGSCWRLQAGQSMDLDVKLGGEGSIVLALWMKELKGTEGSLEIYVNESKTEGLSLDGTDFEMQCCELPADTIKAGVNQIRLRIPKNSTSAVGIRCVVLSEQGAKFRYYNSLEFTTGKAVPIYGPGAFNAQYTEDKKAWVLRPEKLKECSFNFTFKVTPVTDKLRYCLTLVLGRDTSECSAAVQIMVNNYPLVSVFSVHMEEFGRYTWQIPGDMIKQGINQISIMGTDSPIYSTGKGVVFLRGSGIEVDDWTGDLKNWMAGLDDMVTLDAINLPGSHDAAAINRKWHTPYACHFNTITEQLNSGIRLLDIRIKIKPSGDKFTFVTCHGHLGGGVWTLNEYQSLESLLGECRDFLQSSPREALVLTLKVDDWSGIDPESTRYKNALTELKALLNRYPVITEHKDLLPLGQARGKMVLYSRIENTKSQFGCPLHWADNTQGDEVPEEEGRNYKIYVQDYYKLPDYLLGETEKMKLIMQTFWEKVPGKLVLNYASGTVFRIMGASLQKDLILYFGLNDCHNRPQNFGWLFMDYEDEKYYVEDKKHRSEGAEWLNLVKVVVASNYGYRGLEKRFDVLY